ncbi:hypothetical protein R3X39_26240, partial [Salmonella enterica subsp. enterica serovar Agona]|nr:hypothetical protein [Salmonella enterica subsp. enterica serovar Agona]
MNMRRRRRIAKSHRISRADDFAPQGLHGCQHALRGRPVLFPNFSLGEEYEHAPPATNRQISPYLPSGRFRT